METMDRTLPEGPQLARRRFVTTRWSLVVQAGAPDGTRALSQLCRAYWAPVHAFIQGHGLTRDDAADVTQGFFERLLMRGDIARVDQARGRFRSWLRKCAHYYLCNWFAQQHGLTVGGRAVHVSIDVLSSELGHEQTPERLFERQWALTVMDRALKRLQQRYESVNKGELFAHLHGGITGGASVVTDQELSLLLTRTVGSIKVERHRLKQCFQGCLRAEVADTLRDPDPEEVDNEIRRLIDVLA